MSSTRIIEGPELTPQNLKMVTPEAPDFEFMTEAYLDYYINGSNAADEHMPDRIAEDYDEGDVDAPVRILIVAAFLNWKEIILPLKEKCFYWGWTAAELKTTLQYMKSQQTQLEDLYKKYCEPAFTRLYNYRMGIDENLTEEVEIEEAIEKHEELNPALFTEEAVLKVEVKEKINEIVDEFLKNFEEVNVELTVKDIVLTGSNASYNYTKDSDLDIHIIADTSNIEDTLDLHKVIYDAYKSAFNKKFEIELNKVPVEVYVETQDTPLVSNGIYSVINDNWVKEPTKDSIPEVDQEAIDKAFKPWEKRYKALVADITDETKDESEIDRFIDSLYDLRKKGLSTEGEYSIENLVFKEVRNNGYLDNLKELRHKVIAQRLSLYENLDQLQSLADCLNALNSLN